MKIIPIIMSFLWTIWRWVILLVFIDKKTGSINKEWNTYELIEYSKNLSEIRFGKEITISYCSKCCRWEIERIEITPSFNEMIKNHSDDENKYNDKYLYFKFLYNGEAFIDLFEWFFNENIWHYMNTDCWKSTISIPTNLARYT